MNLSIQFDLYKSGDRHLMGFLSVGVVEKMNRAYIAPAVQKYMYGRKETIILSDYFNITMQIRQG